MRTLAHVLQFAVDVQDQRFELRLEANVIVRAAQPALAAELVKRDAAHRAGLLIELRQFLGGLADGHLMGQHRRHASDRRRLARRGSQILPGVLLAEVQLHRFAAGQFGNVKRGRLFALLAFHGSSLQLSVHSFQFRSKNISQATRILSATPLVSR